jgi:hypothetical protein
VSSRPVVGSTQSSTKCVARFLSLGVKRPEREADHSPPSSVKVALEFYSSMPLWRRQE